jgi:hypothetical protein
MITIGNFIFEHRDEPPIPYDLEISKEVCPPLVILNQGELECCVCGDLRPTAKIDSTGGEYGGIPFCSKCLQSISRMLDAVCVNSPAGPSVEPWTCPVAEAVALQIKERAKKGLQKYGVNAARTDLTPKQWLQHLQEELLDASVYLERLKDSV